MKTAVFVIGFLAAVQCSPVQNEGLKNIVGSFVNCMNSDLSLCLKEQALKVTERLGSVRKLKLTDSITLLNNGEDKKSRSLEPLSSDNEARKLQITSRLWDSTAELLQNTDLEFTYGGSDEERALGDVEESRGKKKDVKKKLKMLIPLAIIAKIKGAVLAVVFLGIIAISLFKIAAILKLAFLAKVFTLVKSLLQKKLGDDHPPHHEEHHGWESAPSSGWSRSQAQNLAYSAYRK